MCWNWWRKFVEEVGNDQIVNKFKQYNFKIFQSYLLLYTCKYFITAVGISNYFFVHKTNRKFFVFAIVLDEVKRMAFKGIPLFSAIVLMQWNITPFVNEHHLFINFFISLLQADLIVAEEDSLCFLQGFESII